MEIALLIILIILFWSHSSKLSYKIDKLTEEVRSLRKQPGSDQPSKVAGQQPVRPVVPPQPEIKKETPPVIITPPPSAEPKLEKPLPLVAASQVSQPVGDRSSNSSFKPPIVNQPPVAGPSFFERHPDLEKFIGENLVNKIGIAILVLGIGFFVKYAIDKNWIHEIGRVFIGILCGGILLGIAHRLRRTFAAFSSVLVGGGISVLYFTIAIAFHEYHLFSQTVAFVIMVVITGFSVLLSVLYNRVELAVLSIIGGFATPFMLSTGQGNYVILFTYIIILNSGMLVLAYFKKWNILNILAYAFTILLFGGWLFTKVLDQPTAPYSGALFFATIFYILFFLMNIINNIKEQRKFDAAEISILLSNTFLYYACGYALLQYIDNGKYAGSFTAGLGVFNFAFAWYLLRRKADPTLLYLLIGLVLTFISLAGPVQLEGNYITLFWAAEAVLLLWLSQKSGFKIIRTASFVVNALMLISLVMDWRQIYFIIGAAVPMKVIINKAFITSAVSIVSLAGTTVLLKKENKEEEILPGLDTGSYRQFVSILTVLFLYVSLYLELDYQMLLATEEFSFRSVVTGAYNFAFVIALFVYANRQSNQLLTDIVAGLATFAIVCYVAFYHGQIVTARYILLDSGKGFGFFFHYITLAFVVALIIMTVRFLRKPERKHLLQAGLWFTTVVSVFIVSAELCNITVLNSFKVNPDIYSIVSQTNKIGFPILWSLCSFVLMYIGMKAKVKDLRIISLTLFLITIVKLFAFDIRGISEGGKIAAFISLGIVLLIVSFMYQKLKEIILTDENDEIKNAGKPA